MPGGVAQLRTPNNSVEVCNSSRAYPTGTGAACRNRPANIFATALNTRHSWRYPMSFLALSTSNACRRFAALGCFLFLPGADAPVSVIPRLRRCALRRPRLIPRLLFLAGWCVSPLNRDQRQPLGPRPSYVHGNQAATYAEAGGIARSNCPVRIGQPSGRARTGIIPGIWARVSILNTSSPSAGLSRLPFFAGDRAGDMPDGR